MINCPNCGQQLIQNPDNPKKMTCPSCSYTLDGSQNDYWGSRGANAAQPQTQQPLPQQGQPQSQTQPQQEQQPQAQPQQGQAQGQPQSQAGVEGMPNTAQMPYSQLNEAAVGYQNPQPQYQPPLQPQLPKGMAIAALVLGIIAILFCWFPVFNAVSIVLGIISLILGIMGVNKASKGLAGGKGMGVAGIILGAIALVISIVVNIATFALVNAVLQDDDVQGSMVEMIERMDGDDYPYSSHSDSSSPSSSSTYDGHTTTADDNAPWTSMEFTFDGKSFKMMETTLESFESQTGWTIDLYDEGYADNYMVDPGGELRILDLENASYEDDNLWVSVYNNTSNPVAIKQCVLSDIDYESDNPTAGLKLTVYGGVGVGNTIDEVVAALGAPQDDYKSTTGSYRSISYETTRYDKNIEFVSGDGKIIDEVELTVYNW